MFGNSASLLKLEEEIKTQPIIFANLLWDSPIHILMHAPISCKAALSCKKSGENICFQIL